MRSLAVLVLALCILGITASFPAQGRTLGLFNHNSRARALNADVCPTYSCVSGNGTACGAIDATKSAICTQKDGYCSTSTGPQGTCATYGNKKVGETCESFLDCDQSGYGLACLTIGNNKVCNSQFGPGTPCSNDNNCYYSSPTDGAGSASCVAKRCKGDAVGATCDPSDDMCLPPLTCSSATQKCIAPQNAGANCSADEECVQTAYCSSMGVCTARIALGQPCKTGFDSGFLGSCAGFATCSPTVNASAGTCVTGFSVADGQNCSSDYECKEGSYCNSRVTPAKCTKAVAFSDSAKTACTVDTDCPAGQGCDCDGQGSNKCFANLGNYKGLASQYKKLADCADQCLRTDIDCAVKCKGAFCSLNQGGANEQWKYASLAGYPSCFKDKIVQRYGLDGYFLCSSASAVAGSVFVVVAALIALLF